MSAAVVFEDVSFAYEGARREADKDVRTLHDISLRIEPGEFVGIVGNNGAGKTTLTKLINGLLMPSSGRVTIDGTATSDIRTSLLAQRVGMLFQNPDHQICQPTVAEEIGFSLRVQGESDQVVKQRVAELLEDFNLPASADPFTLSRGQRQNVALASVIASRPDLLVLDEPTCGLDYRECTHIMQRVRELCDGGTTVVMVSHDMELVYSHVTRLVVMARGHVIADGDPETIFRNDDVMKRSHVAAPQMIELSQRLADAPAATDAIRTATTVAHMVDAICGVVPGAEVTPVPAIGERKGS